MDRYHVAYR